MPSSPNILSGRRGYWRYLYGTHGWFPTVEQSWLRGIIRDTSRMAIPANALYDSVDFLHHEPGVAIKRGGTSYAGPAFSSGTNAVGVAWAEFPAGSQLVAVNNAGALFKVTSAATTSLGGTAVTGGLLDQPKLRIGGTQHLLVLPCGDGSSAPVVYDGSAAPAALGGSPPGGTVCEIFKERLVLAGSSANPQRLYFSPALDITSTWDTSDAWIDSTHAVTALVALRSVLLIFSLGHVEQLIGTTPPPGSDMNLLPLGDEGCTDARSIVVQEANCLFCNPRGVWLTNGAGFASLTTEGGIDTYWRSLLDGYDPSTWTICAGVIGNFYLVTITDDSGNVTTLMCNVPQKAWWRLGNVNALMFAQAVGTQNELYYADRLNPRAVAMSGIFTPTAANKNDADGTAVQPTLTTRALGENLDVKAFGNGHLSYDMRADSGDTPTLALQVARGAEAEDGFAAVAESPFAATSKAARARFSTGGDGQAASFTVAQTGASASTQLFGIEFETRPYPLASDGVGT